MKVGCGFVEKTVHGQRYLYIWSFESRGYGQRKVERYLGPASRPEVRARALRELDVYAARAMAEIERRRARWRRQLTGP
jgi:hypothetical protein